MEIYRDIDGDSSVSAYEIGHDFIIVQFTTGGKYLYNYSVTGSNHVQNMINLAKAGNGLNGYINRYVKRAYARRIA